MTNGFSNLNLDIKSIRKIERQTKTTVQTKMETDRQSKSETDRQRLTESQ